MNDVKIVLIAAVGLMAAMAPSAQAQTLWQNVKWGMTSDQVKISQPTARPNDKASNLHDGSTCELKIENYEVQSDAYDVCFYFKSDSLTQVTMTFDGSPSKVDFDSVVLALTTRYGQPLRLKPSSLGWDADWNAGDGVNVSVILLDKYFPLMNINYQVRLAKDASKF